MPGHEPTINEVDFCAQMAASIGTIVAQNPGLFPFQEARVEGYGTGEAKRKRKE